jgi:hypothetical protein
MILTREEKLDIMRTLNWDYDVSSEEMLEVIEGSIPKAGPFDRSRLLVRSLERVSWHRLIALWGTDAVKELYTPALARRLRSPELRRTCDFAIAILRREPVSVARWGSECYKSLRDTVFSNRWYRS